MSQVIETAHCLCLLLGRLKDVPKNLRSDRPTRLTYERLMPTRFKNRKQLNRFCKDILRSIEKNFLVEHGQPGEKAVTHLEDSEACYAPNFAYQRGRWVAWR